MHKGRTKFLVVMVVAVFFCTLGLAMAAGQFTNDGNGRKGKYLYRKSCRTCHDGSQATELAPNSKTQAQWERTFSRYERLECVEEWEKLSDQDLTDIFTYVFDGAYDSPQPATCG